LDVGKNDHHAWALDAPGKRVYDRPLPNDEAALHHPRDERRPDERPWRSLKIADDDDDSGWPSVC
jgi:hypothetical protein